MTWYLRNRVTGQIVNAVDGCKDRQAAEQVFKHNLVSHFLDEHPPLEEIKHYEMWSRTW